jgi:glycine cleavage system regulatory protein
MVTLELEGPDRPGIVRDLSRGLADRGVSIEELHTEIVDAAADGHTFRVKALLAVPAALANDELKRSLDALASEMVIDLDAGERAGGNGSVVV